MPNLYNRATPLHNVRGRIQYLKNPDKQEKILAIHDGAAELLNGHFWKQLSKESQEAFERYGEKSRTITKRNGETEEKKLKCCEGREIMITLSNSLLERMSPEKICSVLADTFKKEYGLTVAIGLHLKGKGSKKDNLHAHVVFPERQLLAEPEVKIAERALFFDADGKRRYKKSEILDENKQLLPGCRVIKKGEVYEKRYFGAVNQEYYSKEWLKNLKTNVILPLRNDVLRGDVEVEEYNKASGKLTQQHVQKWMTSSAAIRVLKYNEMVVEFNRLVDRGVISRGKALDYQAQISKSPNKNKVLQTVLWQVRADRNRESRTKQTIYTRTDWKIQSMVDAVRVAREENISSAVEFDDVLKKKGKELAEAKREYAKAQESGDVLALMDAAKKIKEATENYKKVAKAKEATQHKTIPNGPDDR